MVIDLSAVADGKAKSLIDAKVLPGWHIKVAGVLG
jgi:hypothetical protein